MRASLNSFKMSDKEKIDSKHVEFAGEGEKGVSANPVSAALLTEDEVNQGIQAHDEMEVEYFQQESIIDRILFARVPVSFGGPRYMTMILGAFAAVNGILCGMDQSVISAAQIKIRNSSFHPSPSDMSMVSSFVPLGAITGSVLVMPLNHVFGRRGSIIISCLSYILGSGLCAGSRGTDMLLAGRFFVGIGVGVENCVGMYIAECVPPHTRGSFIAIYQVMIELGQVMGYAAGAIFFDTVAGDWRFMLGAPLPFSVILLLGMFFLPESPRWLVSRGKNGRAWHTWKCLRDSTDLGARVEFLDIEVSAHEKQIEALGEPWYQRYLELVIHKRNRRALVFSVVIALLAQLTGINAVMYNVSDLVTIMNFSERKSVLMSMVAGAALFLGSLGGLFVDKFRRRQWAQLIGVYFIGLVLLGVAYQYRESKETFQEHRSLALGLFFTGLIIYMAFIGAYGCLSWIIPSESFDIRTRGAGMAVTLTFLNLFSFIATYNFKKMQGAFTPTGLMIGFYGGIAALGFIYQIFFMPETKDKTLEEMDEVFTMPTLTLVKKNLQGVLKTFSRKNSPRGFGEGSNKYF